jgi:hypothetical protein
MRAFRAWRPVTAWMLLRLLWLTFNTWGAHHNRLSHTQQEPDRQLRRWHLETPATVLESFPQQENDRGAHVECGEVLQPVQVSQGVVGQVEPAERSAAAQSLHKGAA